MLYTQTCRGVITGYICRDIVGLRTLFHGPSSDMKLNTFFIHLVNRPEVLLVLPVKGKVHETVLVHCGGPGSYATCALWQVECVLFFGGTGLLLKQIGVEAAKKGGMKGGWEQGRKDSRLHGFSISSPFF